MLFSDLLIFTTIKYKISLINFTKVNSKISSSNSKIYNKI